MLMSLELKLPMSIVVFFDIIAYGLDGEYIVHNIVKKFSEKNYNRDLFLRDFQTLENIKGIIFKKNNVVVRNKPSEVIENLDELPFPAREALMELDTYRDLDMGYGKLQVEVVNMHVLFVMFQYNGVSP